MQTVAEFISKQQLDYSCVRIPARTDRPASDWDKTARHFVCTFTRRGFGPATHYAVQYSQGSAHTKPPQAADVLDSLASDAQGTEQAFEDWAPEYGYDTDSREAFRCYEACKAERAGLLALLGREALAELLHDTERL